MSWFNPPGGAATQAEDTDIILIAREGVTYSITRAQLAQGLNQWAAVQVIDYAAVLVDCRTVYLGDTQDTTLGWVLPSAVGKSGQQLYLENVGTSGNALTVDAAGAQTVEGAASIVLLDGQGLGLYSDGANWRSVKSTDPTPALLLEAGLGEPSILTVEATLTSAHGTVFLNPPDGATVAFHLPVYGSVSGKKRYKLMNTGQGEALMDSADGKLINNEATSSLAPGDTREMVKDGTNWRAF